MESLTPSGGVVTGSIIFIALAVAATLWVARRYKAVGALGLVAMLVLPFTQLSWWTEMPGWTSVVASIATVALFIIGMMVNKNVDEIFHVLALAVSLFGKPLLGILSGTMTITVPTGVVLVIIALAVIGVVVAYNLWRNQGSRQSQEQASSTAS